MKKLVSLLSSLSIIISSVGADISCSNSPVYKNIYMITGQEGVFDGSFNENIYNGIKQYISGPLGIKNKSPKALQSLDSKIETFNKEYSEAYTSENTDAVVLNSFIHNTVSNDSESHTPLYKEYSENYNISTVVVDAPGSGRKTVGVEFRSDMAGFYAGMTSIIWSILNGNYNVDGDHKDLVLGTFGGTIAGAQESVTSYMAGFYEALSMINYIHTQHREGKSVDKIYDKLLDTFKNADFTKFLEDLGTESSIRRVQNFEPKSDNDPEYVSGNFNVGGGIDISKRMYDKKVNILMPVAGKQTSDALILWRNKYHDNKVKLIGVDYDNLSIFGSYKGTILTSALKKLGVGVQLATSHTNAYFANDDAISRIKKELNKDKNLTITLDDGNIIDFNNADWESWEGKNVWLSGDISYGGDNLIDEDLYNKVVELFPFKAVFNSSINYMKNTTKNSYELLSSSFLNEQAKFIYDQINS